MTRVLMGHGTRAMYVREKCRCLPCCDANRDYQRLRDERAAAGVSPWADEETMAELHDHLQALRESGVGTRTISNVAGISRSALRKAILGLVRVKDHTAQAILSVPLGSHASAALIPAGETWRLIEEMLSAGATRTRISHAMGNKSHALQLKRDYVTKRNADRVRELHDRFVLGSERMRSACRCPEWRNDELERLRVEKARSRERLREEQTA